MPVQFQICFKAENGNEPQQGTMWHFGELHFVYVSRFVSLWVLSDVNKRGRDLLPFRADQTSQFLFWKRLQFRRAAEG